MQLRAILAGIIVAALAVSANADWMQWPASAGGNNHWYMAVHAPSGINWADAQATADALGGYLATVHSMGENAFVYALVDTPEFWMGPDTFGNLYGPWLGGYQPAGSPEPAGGWSWVSGEPWTYGHWSGGEPNNWQGNEDRVCFIGPNSTMSSYWNDNPANSLKKGYVVESTVPEPVTALCILMGILVLPRRR